jgi:hypothetical protein
MHAGASRWPRGDAWIAAGLFVATLAIFTTSRVHQFADSYYAMLLSEHLLTRGSFALEEHFPLPLDPARYPGVSGPPGSYPYQLETVDSHVYYLFPVGSSILSIPFVAALRAAGVSTIRADGTYDRTGDKKIQALLASLLMAGLAAMFFATARLVLSTGWSLVTAVVGALGTQVWSTAALALWSDTWGIFLLGAVVWMLLAHEARGRPLHAPILATLVAFMYIVRPTYALVVIAVGAYLGFRRPASVLPYGAVGLAWLAGFIGYSWIHFHRALPRYYVNAGLTFDRFWTPLAANLVSPGRGLFVYVPITLFAIWLVVRYRRTLPHPLLAAVAGAVAIAHLVVVSGFSPWFAGHSYGPRFMTGIVPWLFLLGILGVRAMLDSGPPLRRTLAAGAALGALSIFMQHRGAHVPATWAWNQSPPIETHADEKVWSWRAPQFAARPSSPDLR